MRDTIFERNKATTRLSWLMVRLLPITRDRVPVDAMFVFMGSAPGGANDSLAMTCGRIDEEVNDA